MSVEAIRIETESYLDAVKNDPFDEFQLRAYIYREIIKPREEALDLANAIIILRTAAPSSITCRIQFYFLDKTEDVVDIAVS